MRDLDTIDTSLAIHLSLRNLFVAFAHKYPMLAKMLAPMIDHETRAVVRLADEHNRAVDEMSEAERVIMSALREGRFASIMAQA